MKRGVRTHACSADTRVVARLTLFVTQRDSGARRKATKPAFVELIAPQEECVIEFEAPSGNKMRVQWKASTPRDGVSLLRAWA